MFGSNEQNQNVQGQGSGERKNINLMFDEQNKQQHQSDRDSMGIQSSRISVEDSNIPPFLRRLKK